MTEKYIPYRLNGEIYDIPESESFVFENDYPDATIEMHLDGEIYDIPLSQKAQMLKDYPNAVYTFDKPSADETQPTATTEPTATEQTKKEKRKERLGNLAVAANDSLMRAQNGMNQQMAKKALETESKREGPSWLESGLKGAGAGFTRFGKGLYDTLIQLSSNYTYIDPLTGELVTTPDYDTLMKNQDEIMVKEALKAGEVADRLSKEADPTGGEEGFVDLIKEGKIGTALQKGLATGAESLPMTLSAANPYTMALNMVSMAGSNYAEQTLDNPEVDKWKRASMAIGSAALEQAVEKFADPVFKYIGGGKATSEITEQLAKEILQNGTNEATESIAKRIFNVLKNTAKDAGGEGIEEVVTSFGNDALGEALDLISGDKDFGVRAQWEKMQEENPDASLEDFAKSKAKEYMDSFIGGALSGTYMSGTMQSVNEIGLAVDEKTSRKAVDDSYKMGAGLDYQDMYDSDDIVKEAKGYVTEALTGDNGEVAFSEEFIDGLTAEDAYALSRSENVTPQQKKAFEDLARAKAVQEGLNKKLDDRFNTYLNEQRAIIEGAVENDSVVIAMHNGKPVYVMGAEVQNDGTVNVNGTSGPVVIRDAVTGVNAVANSSEISGASAYNAEQYLNDTEASLRSTEMEHRETARNTMSPRAKMNSIQPLVGKKILVNSGNGIIEVEVQRILPKSREIQVKGKKGDLGGQSIVRIPAVSFYDSISRDEDGNPMFAEAGQETGEQTTEAQPTAGNVDYRGETVTILINGVPTEVEVTSQDDTADSIVYEYIDENGRRQIGNTTVGAFTGMVEQAKQPAPETPAVPEAPTDELPPIPEGGVPVVPDVTSTPEPAPVEVPVTPETINWDELFERDPEAYFAEMQKQFGDKTVKRLNAVIASLQNRIEALNKAKPQTDNEIFQNEEEKEKLQARIDILNEMVARLTPAPEAPVAPVAETPTEPVGEQPTAPETPAEPAPVEPTEPEVPAEPQTPEPVAPEVPAEPEPAPAPQPEPEPVPTAPTEPTPAPSPAPAPKTVGAFGRMVKAFKGQIDKLIKKTEVKDFVGTDNTRPVMTGVYRANGYEYASDSMILVKVKAEYPAEQEGKIISVKTGKEIQGRYPDADGVIASSTNGATPLSDNIDDIIAYAQTLEEIKKGMDKDAKLYVRVGNSIFESTRLLNAAKMAKKHGLTTILQKSEAHRAMVFEGSNGVIVVMPTNGTMVSENIIDPVSGQVEFGFNALNHLKTPATLKGIEAAKTTLEAVLPRLTLDVKEQIKESGELQYVDGKVVLKFDKADIAKAKAKAKDANTYAALEEIENNGLVVPMSQSDAESIFPELFVSDTGVPTGEDAPTAPIAPNPVANPISEAKKKERQLELNLAKIGLSPEQKQDLAFNAGKAVADMFATREEYDDYAENATDFGQYNADFDRGVEESFANRKSPVNSVPLSPEPKGDSNGENKSASTPPANTGRGSNTTGGRTNNGGSKGKSQGSQTTKPPRNSKSQTKVEDKYPARNGNATGKLLVDTFGFASVAIPDTQKKILNTIYDFMMEMSKTLGISPKTLGQGGWLNIRNKPTGRSNIASHEILSNTFTKEISDVSLRFKYSRLSSIAHEWWHSLDRALSYFETGKIAPTATEISESAFTGRKEAWEAVQAVMKALNDSGYTDRIKGLVKNQPRRVQAYYLTPTEQAARAFDQYISDRFAEAGIVIQNYDNYTDVTQPTAEEMKVVAPAIDNLFKVLKEKEGKKTGTSVLYQIGEEMNNESEYTSIVNETLDLAFEQNASVNVHRLSEEETEQAYKSAGIDPETHFSIDTDKPIFISNAALAVINIKQEKATPEQWLKMIEKNGGLKAGEDKWMGLSDWLKSSDKKTLTKQEVMDFISENTIRIEEVNYVPEVDRIAEEQKQIAAVNDEFKALRESAMNGGESYADAGEIAYQQMVDKYGDDFSFGFGVDMGELYVSNIEAASTITGIEPTQEREIEEIRLRYTTEGLDNKKEIAFVVPTIGRWNFYDDTHFGDAGDGRAVAWVRFGEARTYAKEFADFYDFQQKMKQKYFPERTINALGGTDLDALTPDEKAEFERLREIARSIPSKNRTNRRVLVIDEIQSKRHQEGREQGYQSPRPLKETERLKTLRSRKEELLAQQAKINDEIARETENEDVELAKIDIALEDVMNIRQYDELTQMRDEILRKRSKREDALYVIKSEIMHTQGAIWDEEGKISQAEIQWIDDNKGKIPDAPFDKNWHELAMKRMLRYAAENGYDAVAWTNGEQQAERYSLTKYFNGIAREDNPSVAGKRFQLYGGNVETLVVNDEGVVTDSTIEEAKGKVLSEVVGKELADKMMTIEDGDSLADEDITVGGEGMKGFYDKMLPAFMNKYGKRWGVKVSDITLPHVEEAGRTMHSVPVTDDMRASVMEGQPMFFKTPNGIVYGWAKGNDIYLTKAGLNPNTKIHEYTHLWANAMMQRNPKGWESIKNLLKGTPVWNQVMNDTNYSDIHGNEDAVASEALSRISGADNAAKMEEMAKQMEAEAKGTMRKLEARGLLQRMKDALNQFWNWVGTELFGIEKFESVEQITDRVLFDLLSGTDLGSLDTDIKEFSKKRHSNYYKDIPSSEYTVLASDLFSQFGSKTVFGCIGKTANYSYICDFFGDIKHPKVRAIFKIDADEKTRRAFDDEVYGKGGFSPSDIDAILEKSWNREGAGFEDFGDIKDRGEYHSDELVDSRQSEDGNIQRGDSREDSSNRWVSVKSVYDGSLKPRIRFVDESEINTFFRTGEQNTAINNLVGEPRLRAIENAVSEEAQKLGVNVTYKTREEMPKGHKNDKGYFNTKTGEIVICTENATSVADAIQTILHEAVAHKGLRQLMGDKFNEFINRVYDSLDAETKAKVDALAEASYNGNTAVAMEEYLASLAENMNFEDRSVWDKVKAIFEDIINAILGRNDIKIGDNELRYILRASYNNMVNPRNMETIQGWAKDQMMREEYNVNQATPELLSRTGVTPDEVASSSAREVYDRVVNQSWNEFQRQFQDAFQPVRVAIQAIQAETGNIPIEDYENYLLVQNQSSSRSRVEIDDFARRYYSPIIESVNNLINKVMEMRGLDTNDKAKRAEIYQELKQYLIAKHGLERNEYYQTHNTRRLYPYEQKKENDKAKKEYDDKVDAINNDTSLTDAERQLQLRDALDEYNAALIEIKTREVPDMRDYSGLTSLFGMNPRAYKKAEDEARKFVDDFEKSLGRVDDPATGDVISQGAEIEKLWKSINSATDKTLRHSYESGLLSRQQYEDIKAMFNFYIPLRGFDETTAEDVYSYARFEGNRFNPAVQTAKGRTSVSDDPIAIIMNMAESEIAQGNKNRAKQALYNYLLNRMGANNKQNSLMQIEDVWYEKITDAAGNETFVIAYPDRSAGETYEEFEERMKALEATDDAYRSKKGNKVDVGKRFQKTMDRSQHYIYLKMNGVEKAIYINGDPKAADAVNGTYIQKPSELSDKMKSLNRVLSSTFTNYSLGFTARNYFRDMLYSHINIDVRESDPAYRKKFRQNWRHNNMRSVWKLLSAYRAGELDGRALTEDEAAFVEFMNNGGQTGYTVINSVENHKAELDRAIKRMQKGIEKGGVKDSAVFKYTLGMVEYMNEVSELVTRFAAFKTSRDMGRGINRAINDAKEITVNFNTRGAQDGKGWFGALAQYFGWSKFFFNASVQGVQNIVAMAKANKLKFCTTVGSVAFAGFLVPVITKVLCEMFGDDDDEYWNIPEYDRQNNLCIVLPFTKGKYAKIPLPIGFREVYAIGDMVAGAVMDKKFTRDFQQIGMDIANKISSVLLPINPLESSANGLNFWHTFLYTALPSSAQFAIQNATNIDWKGAPLQKEYTYNENDPQWMKAYESNPDWMKGLSKWCNEHINLDGDYDGMDWSPEKLDNTLSNLFGGVYSLINQGGRMVSMIWNEENRSVSNIPLVSVVVGRGIDSDERFVVDAYYDMKEYYDSNVNSIKRRAKKFGYSLDDIFVEEKGGHQPKVNEIYQNKNFDFMQEWYKGNKELESLKDKIDRREKKINATENPTEEQIAELLELQNQFVTFRREFVDDMLELD